MVKDAAQARNVLGELDRRAGIYQLAEDRALFWNEFFFPQSIEEYLLFLWLEADAEEIQGCVACTARDGERQGQVCDAHQEAALVHYARATFFRGGIAALLHLDYRPLLPEWIDALGDRWHGATTQGDESISPEVDDQALEDFANQEEIEGNILFYQLRHLHDPGQRDQREQALFHYRATALARRRLIGGWLPQYAVGLPRITLYESDFLELGQCKRQLQEVQGAITQLAPHNRDQHLDEVARHFYLGMVGSGRNTAALNERKMQSMDASIELATQLAPFYTQRSRILEQIEAVCSGRRYRQRRREALEAEWLRAAQDRVQKAQKGEYVYDSDFGVVQVVRRNRKGLTIQTTSGYREPRP